MRKLILLGLCIIAALLVLPYFLGLIAQRQLEGFIQYASQNNAVTLQLTDYKRGWFHSHAKIKIIGNDPKVLNAIYALKAHLPNATTHVSSLEGEIDARIYHGPILIDTHHRGDFSIKVGRAIMLFDVTPDKNMPWLKNLIGEQPVLSSSVQVHLGGSLSFNYHTADINFDQQANATSIKWPGAWGSLWFSSNFKKRRFDFTLGKLLVSGQGSSLNLATSNLSGEQTEVRKDFWLGASELIVPRMQLQKHGESLVQLSGLVTRAESKAQSNNQVDLGLKMTFDRLQILQDTYGPAKLNFKLANLDLDALRMLLKELKVFNERRKVDPQARNPMANRAMLPTLAQLIHNGVELYLQPLEIKVPDGKVLASAEIRLPKLKDWQLLTGGMFSRLYAKVDVRMPKRLFLQAYASQSQRNLKHRRRVERGLAGGLANQPSARIHQQLNYAPKADDQLQREATQQAQNMLQFWLDKKFLVQVDSDYRMTLLLEQGKLSINGNPLFSPGQLLQMSLPLLPTKLMQP